MANLNEHHEQLAAESKWDFSDLKALFINCTLKRSPEVSNTRALADLAIAIMERNGVSVEVIRAVDHEIATGVYPDMTEHGWERDDWPEISEKVMAADILVVLSPIWLGEKSLVCTRVIERLYGNSHLLNDAGPGPSYLDPGSGGPENDFTNRNTTFAAWNLMHLARMVKDAGGIPAHGNQRTAWEAGCRFDFANPDYR
jgi:multimeric flavodoxin WrbA